MTGVGYAVVAAAFVLCLIGLVMYARRSHQGAASPGGPTQLLDSTRLAATTGGSSTGTTGTDPHATHRAADVEAQEIRRAAEADAEIIRQAARAEQHDARAEAERRLTQARADAAQAVADARRAGAAEASALTQDLDRQQAAHTARVARLDETERLLDARESRVASRAAELHELEATLAGVKRDLDARAREIDADRASVDDAANQASSAQTRELERVAGLTAEEARAEVLSAAEVGARRDAAVLVRTIENDARAEGTEQARAIVAEAVQRVASAQTAETVVSVLHLPAEDMKGRIIGREGRNIRSFEAVTGVNVLIDDTPEAVLLSCFDPVRREIGRRTLEKLVQDGRIHPHRIEEAHEQSAAEVDELCLRAARDALAEVGIGRVDERLLPTIGRLKYRTSYGQNVLGHLIETAHIAGVMAAELGVEPVLVKRCAFLHDIGKALTHEVEGSHAIIGAELLRKYGESEAVAHAVEAHHNEVAPRTIEAVLTQASDACSAARPGARRESVETYVKRLTRIEEIATAHPGVEKTFAMQSGREVRVMVAPSQVDDLAASVIAREIAKEIEDELTYPGQIRVTVVRESRSTEIAH